MSLEEHERKLMQRDQDTLTERAERSEELPPIYASGSFSEREADYSMEASSSYIAGDYRSTIFCCACAVDQILKYEYLKVPGNKLDDVKAGEFGHTIRMCQEKNIAPVISYIGQASLLAKIRNRVAAHPIFIDYPVGSDEHLTVRKDLLLEDMRILIELLGQVDPISKEGLESSQIIDDTEGKTYTLGGIIRRDEHPPDYLVGGYRAVIERDILLSFP